jgi:hypothetical protein
MGRKPCRWSITWPPALNSSPTNAFQAPPEPSLGAPRWGSRQSRCGPSGNGDRPEPGSGDIGGARPRPRRPRRADLGGDPADVLLGHEVGQHGAAKSRGMPGAPPAAPARVALAAGTASAARTSLIRRARSASRRTGPLRPGQRPRAGWWAKIRGACAERPRSAVAHPPLVRRGEEVGAAAVLNWTASSLGAGEVEAQLTSGCDRRNAAPSPRRPMTATRPRRW